MARSIKFETDCNIPFSLGWMCKYGSAKFCEVRLESGDRISYFSIPSEVRYGKAPFIRYLKSDEGQARIASQLKAL